MQNPLAHPGIAWCRPPAMLTARCVWPVQTRRAASTLAPAMSALTSCMPPNTGLSEVPSPIVGSACVGSALSSATRSMYAAVWTPASSSSVQGSAVTTSSRSSTPSSRASCNREGDADRRQRVGRTEVVVDQALVEDERGRGQAWG